MPDRSRKKGPPKRKPAEDDPNVAAKRIVDQATDKDQASPSENGEPTAEERSEAARMLGRRGGLRGGPARAMKLSKKRRQEIARRAAKARWDREKSG
jgi:hypothetical protein